ncbi:MAG: hypothetical protein IJJ42_03075 [Clostridia bacterium]|nr:hypothetical protein [Clostridia bacterium]
MKIRNGIAWILAAIMLFSFAAAETAPEQENTVEAAHSLEHLTVASMTRMTGNIFSEMYGNATSDIDVRYLIHGYNLVDWYGGIGMFDIDPTVVSGVTVQEDEAGDRSYLLTLHNDLVYSDGTRITARDYAFSILLQIQMRHMEMGIETDRRDYLQGYADYEQRSLPVQYTEFVTGADGKVREKVLMGRPADGAELAEVSELLKNSRTFTLNAVGELCPARNAQNAIHLDADGVIQDWTYEGGVRTFADGSHATLPGVSVMSDNQLMITINHEWRPMIYEVGLLNCSPYPIHVIAPGVTVKDDGEGVYLANADMAAAAPVFSKELLMETVFNPETGYMYHPSVTSGAYRMVSFDGTTAEFEINPLYKGDQQGRLPKIPSITYTLTDNEHVVEDLATGKIQLVNKVTRADTVARLLQLMQNGEFERDGETWKTNETFQMSNYPRTGLSFVSFRCERPGMDSQAVRQALAWCMDRDAITRDYTGGFGLTVDSWYGIGQWMSRIVDGTMAYPVEEPEAGAAKADQDAYDETIKQWEELSLVKLTKYQAEPERAASMLEAEGWKLNEEGLREKDGQVLDLLLVYPEGNKIADCLQSYWVDNLEQIGVRLTLQPVEMAELLARYYRQNNTPVLVDGTEREPDMFYLASNFELIFDPAWSFVQGDESISWAHTGYADEELYKIALDMRRTEPSDLLSYMKKWIAFEERFNETLPMIPIYSNVYFDFYISALHDYTVDQASTWSEGILGAELSDEVLEEETGTEGEAETIDD